MSRATRPSRAGGLAVIPMASIEGDGDFRLHVRPGDYAVCYWRTGIGGRAAGCFVVELPTEGELKATRGEAGFSIGLVDRGA